MWKPKRTPDLEHGYYGPAAEGFANGGSPDWGDVLDLIDPELWRHYRTSEADIRRGPAVCVLAGCAGATLTEMVRMRRSAFMPLGQHAVALDGNGMHVLARTVPLLKLAQGILARYDAVAPRAPGCDAFFTDDCGRAANYAGLRAQFRHMGQRIGMDGATIPGRLRAWFLAWLDDLDNKCALHHIAGWRLPEHLHEDGVAAPDFARTRAIIERHHPFGSPTRAMLRWQGAPARAFPDPHFPSLSRDAQFALEQLRAGITRCYPQELRHAVVKALASGKRTVEIAEHYGVRLEWVRYHRKYGESVRPLSRGELKALRAYAKSTDQPTARGLQAALEAAGRPGGLERARYWAKKHGIRLVKEQRLPPPREIPDTVRAYLDATPSPTARGLQTALAAAGQPFLLASAREWGKRNGIALIDERTVRTDAELAAVRAYAASTERPTRRGVQSALAKAGRNITAMSAWRWAKQHGIPVFDARQTVLSDGETAALGNYVEMAEKPTVRGLQAALADAGRALSLSQVRTVAKTHGARLVHKKRERFSEAEITALREYAASTTAPTGRGVRAAFAAAGRKMTLLQACYFARKLGLQLVDAPACTRDVAPYAHAPFRPAGEAAAHVGQAL